MTKKTTKSGGPNYCQLYKDLQVDLMEERARHKITRDDLDKETVKFERLKTEYGGLQRDYTRVLEELRKEKLKLEKSEDCTNKYCEERDEACNDCKHWFVLTIAGWSVVVILMAGWFL